MSNGVSKASALPVWRVLQRAIEGDRLPHALLLSASRLAEAESVALNLAGRLLSTPTPTQHPDFFELRPQKRARMINVGTKAERVGGEWPLNSMRRLLADLQLTGHASQRKVAVVYEVDRMNHQTANAFLKTLEEPPLGTTLFLLTERPETLLPTIRSRCMNLRLPETGGDAGQLPDWEVWLDRYGQWLRHLTGGGLNRASAARLVVEAYGLVNGFEKVSADLATAAWAIEKERQPEHLNEDAREANEVGFRKSFRTRLLADIQGRTLAEVRASGSADLAARCPRACALLEKAATLMDPFNLAQPNALEWFFLQSLQVWTR